MILELKELLIPEIEALKSEVVELKSLMNGIKEDLKGQSNLMGKNFTKSTLNKFN